MLIAGFVLVAVARPTIPWFLVGISLVVVGQSIRFWAAGYISKSQTLAVDGPYSIVRNPLYLGSLLIACSYCALSGRPISWAIIIPLFFVIHGSAVMWEERYLRRKFGQPYADYCASVPRWFPRPPAKDAYGEGRVSWAQVKRNQEHRRFLGTVLVVAVMLLRLALGR